MGESVLAGDDEEAMHRAREARELTEARGAMPGFAVAIAEEVVLGLRAGTGPSTAKLLGHGLQRVREAGLEDYSTSGLLHAVAARAAVVRGAPDEARQHLGHVNRLRPRLTAALPWFSVQVRLEAMRACLALADVASARSLLLEVDDILRVRPDLGVLGADIASMRASLESTSEAGAGLWTLTSAELRVLSYLPTHLTFREIADRLYVSQPTVKTQAMAIYSKLGVSSRRAASETAVEHGLLDALALRFPAGTHESIGIG
jgi:LuxR family maltose regulon positive regulatory protein